MGQIDWHKKDEIKIFREKHDKQMRSIIKKRIEARKKEDKEALVKTTRALVKHMNRTKEFEKKAEAAGNSWY